MNGGRGATWFIANCASQRPWIHCLYHLTTYIPTIIKRGRRLYTIYILCSNCFFLPFIHVDCHVFKQPEPTPLRGNRWTPYQPKHIDVQSAGQPGSKPTRSDFGPQRQQVRQCRLCLAFEAFYQDRLQSLVPVTGHLADLCFLAERLTDTAGSRHPRAEVPITWTTIGTSTVSNIIV